MSSSICQPTRKNSLTIAREQERRDNWDALVPDVPAGFIPCEIERRAQGCGDRMAPFFLRVSAIDFFEKGKKPGEWRIWAGQQYVRFVGDLMAAMGGGATAGTEAAAFESAMAGEEVEL